MSFFLKGMAGVMNDERCYCSKEAMGPSAQNILKRPLAWKEHRNAIGILHSLKECSRRPEEIIYPGENEMVDFRWRE